MPNRPKGDVSGLKGKPRVSGTNTPVALESIPYMPENGPALLRRAPGMDLPIAYIGKDPITIYESMTKSGTWSASDKYTLWNAIQVAIYFFNDPWDYGLATTPETQARQTSVDSLMVLPGMDKETANDLFDIGITDPTKLNPNATDVVTRTRELYNQICAKRNVDPFIASRLWSALLSSVAYTTTSTGPPNGPWP